MNIVQSQQRRNSHSHRSGSRVYDFFFNVSCKQDLESVTSQKEKQMFTDDYYGPQMEK